MGSIRYTVRHISAVLDSELRRRAREQGKSLNAVVIETLEQATLPPGKVGDSLDWFIGRGTFEDAEQIREALEWLDSMPIDDRLPTDPE